MSTTALLEVENLCASYGDAQALFGVTLRVADGEVISLLGRNGMGKSTTVKAIMAMLPAKSGQIRVRGQSTAGKPSYKIARSGLGLVPEGRQVFISLTVEENLVATARGPGNWSLKQIHELFPRLKERARSMAHQLSGGEQQMLAIGRALMTNPDLLILDEATEGLAPLVRDEIWAVIRQLRDQGQAILVIDKNISKLSALCDRHYVLERGVSVWQGTSQELENDKEKLSRYLAV